jgi:hypothetical protein
MSPRPLTRYRTFVYDSCRWDGFQFRDGDIVITTPPKCGTTWTQRICALLVFQSPELERPLTKLSPWIDMLTLPKEEVFAELDAQTHRRFIKSHTPMDGLPFDERVTYLCVGRDPRDVMLSWDAHIANANMEQLMALRDAVVGKDEAEALPEVPPPADTAKGRFWDWVHDDHPPTEMPSSLRATLHHLGSFWKARDLPNVVMLHYADLKADLEGQMRALAKRLSIDIPEERWPGLVKAATFAEMKKNADKTAPGVTEGIWQDNSQFFRSGTIGGWREHFDPGDDERYAARVRGLADPGLAEWAHHGSARG